MTRTQKFPDDITIIIRKRDNVGFIALDKKSIKSGITWAGGWAGDEYAKDDIAKPYELLKYKNGSFKLKLSKAAERSYSQSGKLSFWTLEVTAPDSRVFDVGVNSDSLIETMFQTTMVNGDIHGDFFLGRTNGQQSIATLGSLYYEEYLTLNKLKNKPLTRKYKTGNIIINNREEFRFLGLFKSYIKVSVEPIYTFDAHSMIYGGSKKIEKIKIHLFLKTEPNKNYLYNHKTNYLYNHKTIYGDSCLDSFYSKKINGRIKDDTFLEDIEEDLVNAKNKHIDRIEERAKSKNYYYLGENISDYLMLMRVTNVDQALEELSKLDLGDYVEIIEGIEKESK